MQPITPQILADDGQNVTVQTAQGDIATLTRGIPSHDAMLQAFQGGNSGGAPSSSNSGFTIVPDLGSLPASPVAAPAVPPTNLKSVNPEVDQTGRPNPAAPSPPPTNPVSTAPVAVESKFTSTAESKSLSPSAQRDIDDAAEKQKAAATAANAANKEINEENQGFVSDYADQVRQIQERQDARDAVMRTTIDQYNKKLSDASDQLGKMKVDPDFFGRLDTGNKIMAGAAIMLGAIGQGLSQSNQNVGLNMVNAAINRDIDAQKTNISNAKSAFEAQKGGYETYLRSLGDERLATIAETNRQLDVLKSSLMDNTAENADSVAQAALKTQIANIDAQKADNMAKYNEIVHKNAFDVASQSGGMKQLEAAPVDIVKKMADTQDNISALRRIQELATMANVKGEIGAWKGRKAEIERALGLKQGTDDAVLQSRLKQYASERLKAMTGRETPNQMEMMKDTFPSIKDHPETFNALLDSEIGNAERELNNTYAQFPESKFKGMPVNITKPTVDVNKRDAALGAVPRVKK